MEKKKFVIILSVVSLLTIIFLYFLFFSEKLGKYYDEEGNYLGECKKTKTNNLYKDYFYSYNGSEIGYCWGYFGPGSSGWKFGCTSIFLLKEPCENESCGQLFGRRVPKYPCELN